MSETNSLMDMAAAAARHAAARQTLIARNIANADTPQFRARDLDTFASVMRGGDLLARGTRPGHAVEGEGIGRQNHVSASAPNLSTPDGNDVSLEDQMVRAADARRQHELALTLFRKSIELVRTGLGRGR